MTLQEKVNEIKMASNGKSLKYLRNEKVYKYGDNPYFDQLIESKQAHILYPETFPQVDYYWAASKEVEFNF